MLNNYIKCYKISIKISMRKVFYSTPKARRIIKLKEKTYVIFIYYYLV